MLKVTYAVLSWVAIIVLFPVILPLAIFIGLLYDPTDTMPMPNKDGKYDSYPKPPKAPKDA